MGKRPTSTETFAVRIGNPGSATVVHMAVKDVLQHPDSLLCKFMQNQDAFKPGETFERSAWVLAYPYCHQMMTQTSPEPAEGFGKYQNLENSQVLPNIVK